MRKTSEIAYFWALNYTHMSTELKAIAVVYHSDILGEEVTETLWAMPVKGQEDIYQVNNIPYYGAEFSADDFVYAKWSDELKSLEFTGVAEFSGNSTVQVLLTKKTANVDELSAGVRELGGETETLNEQFFVVNVLHDTNYFPIYSYLAGLEKEKLIQFAEPVISQKHRDEK